MEARDLPAADSDSVHTRLQARVGHTPSPRPGSPAPYLNDSLFNAPRRISDQYDHDVHLAIESDAESGFASGSPRFFRKYKPKTPSSLHAASAAHDPNRSGDGFNSNIAPGPQGHEGGEGDGTRPVPSRSFSVGAILHSAPSRLSYRPPDMETKPPLLNPPSPTMISAPVPMTPLPSNSLISRIRSTSFPRFPVFTTSTARKPSEDSQEDEDDVEEDDEDAVVDDGEVPSEYHWSSDSSDVPDGGWENGNVALVSENSNREVLPEDIPQQNV